MGCERVTDEEQASFEPERAGVRDALHEEVPGILDGWQAGVVRAGRRRRNGIGRALLRDLIAMARADRFPALSLSVSPFNPVRRLYESVGFHKVGESGTSWTFRLPLE